MTGRDHNVQIAVQQEREPFESGLVFVFSVDGRWCIWGLDVGWAGGRSRVMVKHAPHVGIGLTNKHIGGDEEISADLLETDHHAHIPDDVWLRIMTQNVGACPAGQNAVPRPQHVLPPEEWIPAGMHAIDRDVGRP